MFKAIYNNLPWKKTRKPFKKISLGICAMDKKAKSKPMREILQRLPPELFEIVMFGDDLLVNQPIESWPSAEILIAFYSTGYPTEKVLEYIKLRNPFLINDLEIDSVMKDRRQVYEMLESQGIDVPKHVFVNRDTPGTENVIEEFDEVRLTSEVSYFSIAIASSSSHFFLPSAYDIIALLFNNVLFVAVHCIQWRGASKATRGKTRGCRRPQHLHLLSTQHRWWK